MAFRPSVPSDFSASPLGSIGDREENSAPLLRSTADHLLETLYPSIKLPSCSCKSWTPELTEALSPLLEIPDLVIRIPPEGNFLLNGVKFHSRTEAAAGVLMEQYIPGFELIPWKTIQVPIGLGSGGDLQTVDFRFGNNFIEYHPPRVKRFPSNRRAKRRRKNEPRKLRELRRQLNDSHGRPRRKKKLLQEMRDFLGEGYRRKREMQLRNSPLVQRFSLFVVATPQELYQDVILRFGRRRLPSPERFVALFRDLTFQVEVGSETSERTDGEVHSKTPPACKRRKQHPGRRN
ncbi:MAG: hypothetical protein KDD64_14170 [Bdellovibrionales bacterium]|nr:hypothetical protein [Bdellovibrionales bacterium]